MSNDWVEVSEQTPDEDAEVEFVFFNNRNEFTRCFGTFHKGYFIDYATAYMLEPNFTLIWRTPTPLPLWTISWKQKAIARRSNTS